MCVKERAESVKSWWSKSHFIQTQLVTIITIVFASGAAYSQLAHLKEGQVDNKDAIKEMRKEQKPLVGLIHDIDKRDVIKELRILRLEKEQHHTHTNSANNQ